LILKTSQLLTTNRAAVSGQPTGVSVDLTNLTYMDGAEIRLLFDLVSHLQESNIALKFIAPFESPARRLIQFSGLLGTS
jgi:anti-anti-sigma regulatory factor